MQAITVRPGNTGSARLEDVNEPDARDGTILARTVALGVCGTDRDIVAGAHGEAPPGEERLILGHESLGEVIEAPRASGLAVGDYVVGIVRRPDPLPCPACAAGEWDMCANDYYTERGIKGRHGYGSEFFRIEPEFAVKMDRSLGLLGVLMEPLSIVAKAWDHVDRIGQRSRSWQPRVLLVTGAGPIGLLAALIGAQRGFEIHVLDRHKDGPKPAMVRALGGHHYLDFREIESLRPDVVMECTGAPAVVRHALTCPAPSGIVCLTGISTPGPAMEVDIGGFNRASVLGNNAVFGTVNANRSHYAFATQALQHADKVWLARLITRRVPLGRFGEALERGRDDIKVVIDFDE